MWNENETDVKSFQTVAIITLIVLAIPPLHVATLIREKRIVWHWYLHLVMADAHGEIMSSAKNLNEVSAKKLPNSTNELQPVAQMITDWQIIILDWLYKDTELAFSLYLEFQLKPTKYHRLAVILGAQNLHKTIFQHLINC